MARLSNMRAVRYVDEKRNKGLGADLKWEGDLGILEKLDKGELAKRKIAIAADVQERLDDLQQRRDAIEKAQAISSAFMIPEYVSAGLTNWIWGSCMPVHLFSMSTDAGQEDHVSMAANVAVRLHDSLPRLAEIIAIELAFATQAAALRKLMRFIPSKHYHWHPVTADELRLSPVSEAILAEVERHFPLVTHDRALSGDIRRLGEAVLDGSILRAADASGFVFAEQPD
jgi:histidine ammonia-lyase